MSYPPISLLGGGTYLIYDLLLQHLSFNKFLSDLFFITWFRGESTRYWYILAIVLFYLLFPVIYRFVHSEDGKNGLIKTVVFSVCWFVLIELLINQCDLIDTFRIALERLPIFVAGVYVGRFVYEKREISNGTLLVCLIAGYVAFVALKLPIIKQVSGYLYYPVRGLLAISIMSTVILFMEAIEKLSVWSGLMKLLGWFGTMSLELYLLHQSYMILFEFPYKLGTYPVAAFALPTVTAAAIYVVRKKMKRGKLI